MFYLKLIKTYFDENLPFLVKNLHYLIIFIVLFQILNSDFMSIKNNKIGDTSIEFVFTWIHIIIGVISVVVSVLFTYKAIKRNGLIHFYPYIFKDLKQLKQDFESIKTFKIPEVKTKGLASCVEGLGMLALLLVILSGFVWYLLWLFNSSLAYYFKEIHESLTGLIIAYFIGHGIMGLLHIYLVNKSSFNK